MNETLICVLERHYPSSFWRDLAAAFRAVEEDADLLGWDNVHTGMAVRHAVSVITGSIVPAEYSLR